VIRQLAVCDGIADVPIGGIAGAQGDGSFEIGAIAERALLALVERT